MVFVKGNETVNAVTGAYNYLFKEMADPRVYDWPLAADPWGLLGIILTYLYGIYVMLPSYMADKKPFSLKRVIALYNVFQVVACSVLIYGVATSGWTTHYTLGCEGVDYSENKLAVRMASCMWWHMLLKMAELAETVFFVLRKKFNQVSGLHVYHHVSTLVFAWITVKYVAGGLSSFTVLINSFVHVLMYTYYFLASLGPKMQQKLQAVKSKLTLIQMIQLCIIFLHGIQMILPSCSYPKPAGYLYLPNILLNIILFVNFYRRSYSKKKAM